MTDGYKYNTHILTFVPLKASELDPCDDELLCMALQSYPPACPYLVFPSFSAARCWA